VIQSNLSEQAQQVKKIKNKKQGALRNTIIAGGLQVTDELVSTDIMTPLLTSFKQSLETLNSGIDLEDALSNLLQIVSVISFLCENSETATEIVTNFDQIIEMFLGLILYPKSEDDLIISTCQCLLVISDENEKLSKKFKNSLDTLGKIFSDESKSTYCRTLIAGILFNVSSETMKVISFVSSFLFSNLNFDSLENLSKLFVNLNEDKEDLKEYKLWKNLSNSQKLSLELFSNMNSFIEGDTKEKLVLMENSLMIAKKISESNNLLLASSPLVQEDLALISSILRNSMICIENILLSVSVDFFKNFDTKMFTNFIFSLFERRDDDLSETLTGIFFFYLFQEFFGRFHQIKFHSPMNKWK
jgi:hypothetical protein